MTNHGLNAAVVGRVLQQDGSSDDGEQEADYLRDSELFGEGKKSNLGEHLS